MVHKIKNLPSLANPIRAKPIVEVPFSSVLQFRSQMEPKAEKATELSTAVSDRPIIEVPFSIFLQFQSHQMVHKTEKATKLCLSQTQRRSTF
jgi:hypothetical protein